MRAVSAQAKEFTLAFLSLLRNRLARERGPHQPAKETSVKTWKTCSTGVLTGILIGAALCIASVAAHANLVDTLTGQEPGHEIGCSYTFSNGDPSIPCASDIVAADGTVSFIKPNAPFDGIEYFDLTPTVITPIGSFFDIFFELSLVPNTEYPIFRPAPNQSIGSFFDVFTELDMQDFNNQNLQQPGTFHIGDLLDFNNGVNSLYDSIKIPGFTGKAVVVGFDAVSVPEPGTLALLGLGLAALGYARRKQ